MPVLGAGWAQPPSGARVVALVATLVLADLAFLAANSWHVLERLDAVGAPAWVSDPRWALEVDQGFAEWATYLKVSAAAGALAVLAATLRAPVFAAWVVTFVAIVADDALQIHERASVPLVETFGLPAVLGVRGKDLGELLVWVAFGAVLLPLLAVGHRRSDPWARAVSRRLWWLLGALVIFGAGLDLIHVVLNEGPVREVLVVAEDGGELLATTGMVAVVAAAAHRSRAAEHEELPAADLRAATPDRR